MGNKKLFGLFGGRDDAAYTRTRRIRGNIKFMLALFLLAFVSLIGYMAYAVSVYGQEWVQNPNNSRLKTASQSIISGSILDRKGQVLAGTSADGVRQYALGRAAAQVVGYDNESLGRAGAELQYARSLLGLNRSLIERLRQSAQGMSARGDDVVLTLDAGLQQTLSDAFDAAKADGAGVLLDAATGEILASVSKPDFDPNTLTELWAKYNEDPASVGDSFLVNRVTQGQYPPGSAFKLITALAALELDPTLKDREYDCTGEMTVEGNVVYCYNHLKHGTQNMAEALSNSCNTWFAQLALEIGAQRLLETAETWGFNDDFLFEDVRVGLSNYSLPENEVALAWSALGQDQDIATPLHMALIAAGIVNEGRIMEPKLVYQIQSATGRVSDRLSPALFRDTKSAEGCVFLREAMQLNIQSGTGTKLNTSALSGCTLGGKTGTAEKSQNGATVNEAWFVGYCVTPSGHELAFAIVVEDTKYTASTITVPIAAKLLEKAVTLGY